MTQWTIVPGSTIGGKQLGTFQAEFTLHSADGTRSHTLNGVVDTGASYSVIPAVVLDELNVNREEQALFSLADGSVLELSIGHVLTEMQGETKSIPVVFGNDLRKILIGAITLERFALAADPVHRRLVPAELTL